MQLLVVVQLFGENDPDHYDGDEQPGDRIGMAWRAVAREDRPTNPLQFWEVPTGSLPQ
jgi:hypothetical protein